MSEGPHPPGLWPVPGDGVLAKYGNLILLSSLDDGQFVDVLLDLLEEHAASGGDGRRFADAIADAIEASAQTAAAGSDAAASDPSVLAFGPAGSGLAVTVSGGAWAEVTTSHGQARVEAGHPGMLLRCVLRSVAGGVRGGLSPSDNGAATTDRFSRLDAGTVRAGGLSYFQGGAAQGRGQPAAAAAPVPAADVPVAQAREAPAVPLAKPAPDAAAPREAAPSMPFEPTAAWQAPAMPDVPAAPAPQPTQVWVPEPDQEREVTEPPPDAYAPAEPFVSDEPFEAVLLNAGPGSGIDVPQRQPLSKARDMPPGTSSYVSAGPIIQGVYCKNGHFDDPEALFCAICGISMNQQTLVPRPGERPPLGVLLLDDGAVFQLDNDYVMGREPNLDASVAAGRARPLRISDDAGIVSRVHARVQLDGWRVLVTDLGSANGTRVLLPGQPADQQLVPQIPIVLATGSQVDLGGRGFRYESHRGR